MIKSIAGLLTGLCFAFAAQAKGPLCEHPYPQCAVTEYPVKNDRCENPKCAKSIQAPNMPNVYCTYLGSGYDCEIWPRGPNLSYIYAASGPVQVSDTGPTYQSNVWVQCGLPARPGGVISVTAVSPTGLSSPTKTVALSCRDQAQN